MKRTWVRIVLYLGCIALILLQGYRIHQLQQVVVEDHTREQIELYQAKYYAGDMQTQFDNCIRALRNSLGPGNLKK
jgi:hypothetical protein